MKSRTIIPIVLCTTFLLSCSRGKMIELPLTPQSGYGPFQCGIAALSHFVENETNMIDGFKGLTDIKYGNIETNGYQSDFQDYTSGKITKEQYEKMKQSWSWIPGTLYFSETHVKTKIAFAYGKDSTGILRIVVDTNNNSDLSDDEIFTPIELDLIFNEQSNKDSLVQAHSIHVSFETFIQNKIVSVTVPLLIMHNSQLGFVFNFSQYATTRYKGEQIAVCWDGFTRMAYTTTEITLINTNEKEVILQNEFIEIKGEIYKNLGFNANKNALILEKINLQKTQITSAQVGYKSFPFHGDEFTTKLPVSLESLKGKYILLDFWATWCSPCIQELTNLKELYAKIDTSKFEIIGIVGDSQADALNEVINQHQITWPQIMSDNNNEIIEKFGISMKGYPTSYLLNPKGIIIAKNLRGKELVENVLARIKE